MTVAAVVESAGMKAPTLSRISTPIQKVGPGRALMNPVNTGSPQYIA